MTLGDNIAHCVFLIRLGRPHPNFFFLYGRGGRLFIGFLIRGQRYFRVTLGTLNSMKKFRLVFIIYPLTSWMQLIAMLMLSTMIHRLCFTPCESQTWLKRMSTQLYRQS